MKFTKLDMIISFGFGLIIGLVVAGLALI